MGLEAINFVFIPSESKLDTVLDHFSSLSQIVPKIGGEEGRYITKTSDYLIDFLVQGKCLSIRVALCCSEKSVRKVFDIFKLISAKYGGQLKVLQTKLVIEHFTNDDLERMFAAFEKKRRVFVEQIADISDMPLGSEEVFKYIRANDIKPKGFKTQNID